MLCLTLLGELSFEIFSLQRYKSHIWTVADPFLYLSMWQNLRSTKDAETLLSFDMI